MDTLSVDCVVACAGRLRREAHWCLADPGGDLVSHHPCTPPRLSAAHPFGRRAVALHRFRLDGAWASEGAIQATEQTLPYGRGIGRELLVSDPVSLQPGLSATPRMARRGSPGAGYLPCPARQRPRKAAILHLEVRARGTAARLRRGSGDRLGAPCRRARSRR